MTQLVVDRYPLTQKLRDVLRAISGLQGAEIARTPAPAASQPAPALPYAVLYPLDDEDFFGGWLESMESGVNAVYQVTSVGQTAMQAEMTADRVRSTFLGRASGLYVTSLDPPVTAEHPSGLRVVGRWSLGRGAADPDSLLVSIPERFRFALTIP